MKKKCQECWIFHHFECCLLLAACFLVAQSHETYYSNSANIAALLSSLPNLKKHGGESKITRRSPLNLGYVVGIGHQHQILSLHETAINHGVPHMLAKVQAHSISPSLAHTLLSHNTNPMLTHSSRFVAHDLTVTHPTSRHSIMKVVSVGRSALNRDQNHGPVSGLEHTGITHALIPTITHVTTTTVSEHGVTKSPTVTVLDHSLLPVSALSHKGSHGLSKQSTLTLTPECLTKTTIEVNHGSAATDHILSAVTEHAKDHVQGHHTVVHKVSTLIHDPEPVLTHDVSVTHISEGVVLAHELEHKHSRPVVHPNAFRTHIGGFGVGIDFGGHGSGHGFYV